MVRATMDKAIQAIHTNFTIQSNKIRELTINEAMEQLLLIFKGEKADTIRKSVEAFKSTLPTTSVLISDGKKRGEDDKKKRKTTLYSRFVHYKSAELKKYGLNGKPVNPQMLLIEASKQWATSPYNPKADEYDESLDLEADMQGKDESEDEGEEEEEEADDDAGNESE